MSLFGIVAFAAVAETEANGADYETLVRRVALSGETPNALMMSQKTLLRCKSVEPGVSMKTSLRRSFTIDRELVRRDRASRGEQGGRAASLSDFYCGNRDRAVRCGCHPPACDGERVVHRDIEVGGFVGASGGA
jgi:hypothetical protein